jgi:hypothetical protein
MLANFYQTTGPDMPEDSTVIVITLRISDLKLLSLCDVGETERFCYILEF